MGHFPVSLPSDHSFSREASDTTRPFVPTAAPHSPDHDSISAAHQQPLTIIQPAETKPPFSYSELPPEIRLRVLHFLILKNPNANNDRIRYALLQKKLHREAHIGTHIGITTLLDVNDYASLQRVHMTVALPQNQKLLALVSARVKQVPTSSLPGRFNQITREHIYNVLGEILAKNELDQRLDWQHCAPVMALHNEPYFESHLLAHLGTDPAHLPERDLTQPDADAIIHILNEVRVERLPMLSELCAIHCPDNAEYAEALFHIVAQRTQAGRGQRFGAYYHLAQNVGLSEDQSEYLRFEAFNDLARVDNGISKINSLTCLQTSSVSIQELFDLTHSLMDVITKSESLRNSQQRLLREIKQNYNTKLKDFHANGIEDSNEEFTLQHTYISLLAKARIKEFALGAFPN